MSIQTLHSIHKPTPLDLSLLVLQAAMFASAFLAIKVVVPETGPWWLASLRVSIAFLFLLPIAIVQARTQKTLWPKDAREWGLLTIVMALNVVTPFFLISWAELSIDAGVASLLLGVAPFIALIGSHFTTQDDRLTPSKVIGVLCGFSGIVIIVGIDAIQNLGQQLPAQVAVMLAASCYIISGLIVRHLTNFSPVQLSILVLGMASISSVLISIYIVGWPKHSFSTQSWMGLVYLGLIPTGAGILLRYYLIQRIGLSTFSSGMNLIPPFGIAIGVVFLNEAFSYHLFFALFMILTGLFIVQRGKV